MKNALLLTALLGTMPLHAMAQTSAPVPVPAVAPAPASDKCEDKPAAGQSGVAPASASDDSADEEEKDDCQNLIGMKKSTKKLPVTQAAATTGISTAGISTTVLVGIGTAVAVAIGVASSGGSGSSTTHSAVNH